MDYTTLAIARADGHITEATDDTLMTRKVTQASRLIDFLLTGQPNVADYLKLETITDEIHNQPRNPLVDNDGKLMVWPRKPLVTAVTALSYRYHPTQTWLLTDPACLQTEISAVSAWQSFGRSRVMAKLTYTGGLAADTASLPGDVVELATVLTLRLYKEDMSGLSDSIGIADMGMIQYTKALPVRVQEILGKYTRVVPW